MATLEELYDKALSGDDERAKLAKALQTPEGAAAFLAQHNCDATVEELVAFVKEQTAPKTGELSDDDLEAAGGVNGWEIFGSIASAGVLCALAGGISLVGKYILDKPERSDTGSDICTNI